MEDFLPTFPEDRGPVGVYVHIPYCLSRCNYCAFTTDLHDPELEKHYIDLLIREIDLFAKSADFGRLGAADTLYFGGGTPSVIGVDPLVEALEACRRVFGLMGDAETTIEVNPATVSGEDLSEFRRAGFNRVSLGIQSFDDRELRSMGRPHSGREALRAFDDLRSAGFDNISVDLLAGYPGQTLESVRGNLGSAIELGPEHISIYLLEIKEGTKLAGDIAGGRVVPLDEDLAADMYEAFCADAEAAGFEQYEISNFAVSGRVCRHNLKYWRDEVFVGVGLGAHGMTGRIRFANQEARGDYERAIRRGRLPREIETKLTPETRFRDALIMGLRLAEGIDLDILGPRYRVDARAFVMETVGDLMESGLLRMEGNRVFLSRRGRLLSNQVFSRWV